MGAGVDPVSQAAIRSSETTAVALHVIDCQFRVAHMLQPPRAMKCPFRKSGLEYRNGWPSKVVSDPPAASRTA